MNLRRTEAVARKEFVHILRDPISLTMALAIPLVLLLLFGYALSLDVDRIPTWIFDGDRSAASRDLIERFRGSRFFEIRGITGDPDVVQHQIDRNQALLGVSIQRGFGAELAAGRPAAVQLLLDGSDSNTASIALGYAEMLVRAHALDLQARAQQRQLGARLEPPVEPRLRVWYNSELKSRNYIVPGLIAVILMIIAALLTSLTIAREWELGTMEQLLSTPLRPAEIILGKLSAYFAIGLADTVISVVTGVLVFNVPLRGSLLLLAATSFLYLFGALCWGLFLSSVARSQLMAYQMGVLTSFLPSFLLSGFVYAIENMPRAIQPFTYLVPARYFITILKGIYLKGVGVDVLWPQIAMLAAYAMVVFIAATRRMRQKLA